MKPKRLTLIWMPSATSGSRVFRIRHTLFCICLSSIVISWLLLAIGGYQGKRLYHESTQIREQNSLLRHKVEDLDALRQAMEQIQLEQSIIHSLLGLDNGNEEEAGGFGQGGARAPGLFTITLNDTSATASMPSPQKEQSSSIFERAQSLLADLQKLVMSMRHQRQFLDTTPSIIPVKGDTCWFSSGFGWRRNPFTGVKELHNGLDICSYSGAPIIAPANGTALRRGNDKYLGKYLQIDHGRAIITTYGHLSGFNVSPGQKVKRGEVIAFMGNTGLSTGNHLHYVVKVKKKFVDPLNYILNAKGNGLLVLSLQAEGEGQ